MAELGPLPEVAWAKNECYLSTNVGLRRKRQGKLGWGHPNPSRRVTWSLNRLQQSEHEGPCQIQEAEEGASNQTEFGHVLNAKQREVRDLEQLRWKLEKPRLLLLFPRFPSPLSNLGGSETRTGETKQEQKAQSEGKKS